MGTVKYTGPVASFHCPTNAEIRSLKVHFSPKQDGSGDPSPENVREIVGWDGVVARQSGKNLFNIHAEEKAPDNTSSSYVNKRIFQPNTYFVGTSYSNYIATGNASASINGNNLTFSATTGYAVGFAFALTPGEKYKISATEVQKDSGVTTVVEVANYKADGTFLGADTQNYFTGNKYFTVPQDAAISVLCFRPTGVWKTVTLTNIQLEVGTERTAYEPYQGSTTDYEFGVLGKNKFNKDAEPLMTGAYVDYSSVVGEPIRTYSHQNYKIYKVPITPNTTYTFGTIKANDPCWALTDADNNVTHVAHNNGGTSGTTVTFTAGQNDRYLLLSVVFQSTYKCDDVLQLELGSTATTYEPYDPKSIVYGGWVDLISGEVCETYVVYTGGWIQYNSNLGYKFYELKNILLGDSSNKDNISNMINTFDTISSSIGANKIQPVAQGSQYVRAYLELNENYSADTVQYGYRLATPITYYLAPTALQTFLGHNNVWSNADYVEVEYDLHETQSLLQRKAFIMANQPHVVKPAAASLQNFKTDVIAPLKECKVHFGPVQDLHGYDSVWPAGGGKNIAKPYDNNYVSSSYISFDYSAANGTFRCYGTASASSTHSSPSATNAANNGATFTLPAGTYTLSIIDGDGANIYAQCVSSDETVLAETTSYTTFTTNESLTVFVRLKVAAAATVDKTVKIQLEKGSSATSYVPYENVCPISGWNGCNVYRSGKNLFDINLLAANNITISNGVATATATNFGKAFGSSFVPLNLDMSTSRWTLTMTAYTDGNSSTADATGLVARFVYTDGTKQILPFNNQNTSPTTLSITSTVNKTPLGIQISYGSIGANIWHITNVQLEPVLEATPYEPYIGTTLPIDWTTEAGTVYGGYVDLVNGEVWKTYNKIILDGDNIQVNNGNYESNGNYGAGLVYVAPAGKSAKYKNGLPLNLWSENVPLYIGVNTLPELPYVYAPTAGALYFVVYVAKVADHPELADKTARKNYVNEWLRQNPITLVYELETPVLVGTIDPITLKTLRGTNNVWANTSNGNIELAYWGH